MNNCSGQTIFTAEGRMKNAISINRPFTPTATAGAGVGERRKWTLGGLLRQLTDRLHRWRMLARERYLLRTLSDRMLQDIGLSRLDAEREGNRPFWDERGTRR